jgi:hypothetical protein
MKTFQWVRSDVMPWLNRRMSGLQGVLREIQAHVQGPGVWADGDTTPSVYGANAWETANTGATSVTALDDGEPGRIVTVIFRDTNTTMVHGSNLKLSGGVNYTPSAADEVRQYVTPDGTEWLEVDR